MTNETTMTTETATTPEGQGASQPGEGTTDTTATAAATTETTQPNEQQQPTEGTAATEATAGTEAKDDTAQGGAPETYEFKAPDGSEFDPKVIEKFSSVAKAQGLTQEAAQAILDEMGPVLAERSSEALASARAQWVEQARADKEFGGDKFDESLGAAKKAIETFATPELRQLLETSGLGDHPEVIRLMTRIGRAISPDSVVRGQPSAPAETDRAARLYPTMKAA